MNFDNFTFSDWVDLIAKAYVLNQGILSEEEQEAYNKYLEENKYASIDDEDHDSLDKDIEKAVDNTIKDIANNQKDHPNWKEYKDYAKNIIEFENHPEDYGFDEDN